MIKKIAGWTVAGFVALIALGAILGGSDTTKPTASPPNTTDHSVERNTPPAIEPTAAAAKPAKPKAWRTIFKVSGQGSKRTNEFRILPDRKTRLAYTFTGGTNAVVWLNAPSDGEASGDLLLNEIGDRRSSTRLYGKDGMYYLDVEGGAWTVKVQAFK